MVCSCPGPSCTIDTGRHSPEYRMVHQASDADTRACEERIREKRDRESKLLLVLKAVVQLVFGAPECVN